MIKKIEGIVVSTVDYGENSKILNVLTKNEGIIGLYAKGCKRPKSLISSTSNVLTYGIFHFNKKNEKLSNLIEIDIIEEFENIKQNFSKISYAFYITELSSKVYRHESSNNIYPLLITALKKIDSGLDSEVICDIVELKLLDDLGIKPVIDRCVNCGKKDDIITLSSYKGGYLCKNCVKGEKIFNIKTLKLIKMFYYLDLKKVTKLEISTNVKRELSIFINDYYDRYSGLYLKTKKFIDKYKELTSDSNDKTVYDIINS